MKTVQVYMVDTSGSMEGTKKDQLCNQLQNQQIEYLFAFGGDIRAQLKPSELRNYPFNTGTAIQKCLFDMFSRLNTLPEVRKNFVLITDAEDSISDVEGLKKAWVNCRSNHKTKGGYLTGSVAFVGTGGQCTKELEAVFGKVDVVDDKKLQEVLEKFQTQITAASAFESELDTLKVNLTPNIAISQAEIKLDQSKTRISALSTEIESAQTAALTIRAEVATLVHEIKEIQDMQQQISLKKKMGEILQKQAQLENMQNSSLAKCEINLFNINSQQVKLEKKKEELTQHQGNVDDTTNALEDDMKIVEGMQTKLKNLQLKSNQNTNNSIMENILEETESLAKSIVTRLRDTNKTFQKAIQTQMELTKAKNNLKSGQGKLEDSKKIVNEQLDKLVGMMTS